MRGELGAAALGSLALALAGCGDGGEPPSPAAPKRELSSEGGAQTLVRHDGAGDVNTLHAETEAPDLRALDLRRVTLRRDARSLRVTFETAAPQGGPMSLSLSTHDRMLRRDVRVEVDYGAEGPVRARLSGPWWRTRRLPVEVQGRRATVELPLNPFTRKKLFRWQAWSSATARNPEVADTVPNRFGNVGFFPRTPGPRLAAAAE